MSAQNALLCQSRQDALGRCHGDGWGIGFYRGRIACLKKQALPAFEDVRFNDAARVVTSRTVLAHVRLGTIGSRTTANAHPFRLAPFLFAHNGTLQGIDTPLSRGGTLRQQLLNELAPAAAGETLPMGQTDSELMFRWVLSRLFRKRLANATGIVSPERAVEVVAQAIAELDQRSIQSGAKDKSKLNFLLTDGQTMLASRLRHDLFYLLRNSLTPCVVCGQTHAKLTNDLQYHSVIIASEPLTSEPWQALSDGSLLCVSPTLQLTSCHVCQP